VARRHIGQERVSDDAGGKPRSSLETLNCLIDWAPLDQALAVVYAAAKGEPAWPPLAMFKALLLAVWHDLSDVRLAEALNHRAWFRRFCGFSGTEATPERTAFVRYRKALIAHGLDRRLFEAVTAQLKSKAITIKAGTLVDATIIASASDADGDGHWVKHRSRPAVHGFKAHVGADAATSLVEKVSVTPANVHDGRAGPDALPDNPGDVFADSAIAARISAMPFGPSAAGHASPDGDVGSRRAGDARPTGRLECTDRPRARPDREALRHLEAVLRSAPNAMARSRQGYRPSTFHRHRL
jgi:transposase, IS5 family